MDITEKLKINDNIIYNLKLFTPIEDVRVNNNINIYHLESTVVVENVKLDFKINGNWLPWSQLSDGTRRLFYIVSEITNTQALVLLEEPELGVHPHQFHLLMNFLKEQSEHKQIIISTHAPKALDHLNLDELNSIVLVNYDQKNGTQLRHLTDDEQAKAQEYAKEVGYVSDYWMYSDLEE
ncbi:AAA family ATPase [Mucilaginibacter sp. P19]|uniref:AAA family ATPase n=1 Tax=Mucilaginibacter sp. P19 TaxID=3423947 RepID=UPI003D67ED4F